MRCEKKKKLKLLLSSSGKSEKSEKNPFGVYITSKYRDKIWVFAVVDWEGKCSRAATDWRTANTQTWKIQISLYRIIHFFLLKTWSLLEVVQL